MTTYWWRRAADVRRTARVYSERVSPSACDPGRCWAYGRCCNSLIVSFARHRPCSIASLPDVYRITGGCRQTSGWQVRATTGRGGAGNKPTEDLDRLDRLVHSLKTSAQPYATSDMPVLCLKGYSIALKMIPRSLVPRTLRFRRLLLCAVQGP